MALAKYKISKIKCIENQQSKIAENTLTPTPLKTLQNYHGQKRWKTPIKQQDQMAPTINKADDQRRTQPRKPCAIPQTQGRHQIRRKT
jgi:hypothetical protein